MMAMIYVLCSLTLKAFDSASQRRQLQQCTTRITKNQYLHQAGWTESGEKLHKQLWVQEEMILNILDWLGTGMLKDSLTLATCCLLTKRFGSNPAALLSGK